jgi:hypothetical protein
MLLVKKKKKSVGLEVIGLFLLNYIYILGLKTNFTPIKIMLALNSQIKSPY